MKEDQTDFLDVLEPDDAAVEQSTDQPSSTPEPTEAESKAARDEKGRFAKAEQQAVEKGEKPGAQNPAPEPPSELEGDHVPVAALKAERAKRQALEAQLASLQKPVAQTEQPIPKSPDFNVDADDEAEIDPRYFSMKMTMSTQMANMAAGEAQVAEAWEAFDKACQTDPQVRAWSFSPALRNHAHPMGEVLKWHNRQKQVQELEGAGGLDKYREKIIADYLATQQAQPAAGATPAAGQRQPSKDKPTPPPSLANGGAGSHNAPEMTSDDDDFNELFGPNKTRKR